MPPARATAAAAAGVGAPAPAKRGPGRPPSKKPAAPLPVNGVSDEPVSPENILEFVWGEPAALKALFAYLKNLNAGGVFFRCYDNRMAILSRDISKACRIVATLDGDKMNHYYCEQQFTFAISRAAVESIFTAVDKSFHKITLVVTRDDRNHLHIIFKDPSLDKECNYCVEMGDLDADEDLFDIEDNPRFADKASYPISFQLTAAQLKKTVADAKHHSQELRIEKYGNEPLQITYAKPGMQYNEVYRSPEKIKLESTISESERFMCTVLVRHIPAIALPSESIRLHCSERKDLQLECETGNGFTICTHVALSADS
jgi:hypothetical protein